VRLIAAKVAFAEVNIKKIIRRNLNVNKGKENGVQ
jgi:hypothetical protein